MKLFLIRHAIAMDRADFATSKKYKGADDLARPLTDRGQKRARQAFAGWAAFYKKNLPGLIVYSRAVRSRQTAELLAEATGAPLKENALLDPGAGYESLLQILNDESARDPAPQCLALVGHEPALSEMISGLLQSGADGPGTRRFLHLDLKKGCGVEIDLHAPGAGELRNLLPPKVLRQLGGKKK